MTLYRQLLVFTLTLSFILFAGVWLDKLQSTRTFLTKQLASHAQDTATSLGLSLSPFVARQDFATVETMLNAIFDRGHYRSIRITDIHNSILIQRTLDIAIHGVPTWFVSLIPLATPSSEALIMDGWKKAGSVHVESHPGYAYQTLWKTTKLITIYFLLTGVIVFILGGIGIHILLRPLHRVEKQAEAICRREYEIQQHIPRTRELRQVVESMNRMTSKVKEMFDEQAAAAENLRKNAFSDVLTGLGNRRFLIAQVNAVMKDASKMAKGGFQLIQVHDLQDINTEKGYEAGDALIRRAAQIIREAAAQWRNGVAARLNGGDFALLLPNIDEEGNKRLAEDIAHRLARLSIEQLSPSDHICNIGALYYSTPTTLDHLLAHSDGALSAARQTGPNSWQIATMTSDEQQTPAQGRTWQRAILEDALTDGTVQLYAQRVAQLPDKQATLHLELFSRIPLPGEEEIHAETFVPMAARSTMITKLDSYVLDRLLANPATWGKYDLAVNISIRSLLNGAFVKLLVDRIARLPAQGPRLFFEFHEYRAIQHREALESFAKLVRGAGHDIGLDHFGISFSNFGYLRTIRPHYVKIAPAFTRELATGQQDSYFFISALKGVAHSLDIKVIAEGVETEEQLVTLQELGIDGIGGYLIEQPYQFLPARQP
jgi:diguanylate cyclase (GGDEF)-like protein